MKEMKIAFLLLCFMFCCLVAQTAWAGEVCEGLPSRHFAECEASKELASANANMQQAYRKISARMQTVDAKKHLSDAQAAWQAYMKQSCAFDSVVWMSGSGTPARLMACEAKYTKRRADDLQALLLCQTDDCPR